MQLAGPASSMLPARGSAWKATAASEKRDELTRVWLEALVTDMVSCRYVAAMKTVPGGAKHDILAGLKRQFSNVPLLSATAINKVFKALVKLHSCLITRQCSLRTASQPICQASVILQLRRLQQSCLTCPSAAAQDACLPGN